MEGLLIITYEDFKKVELKVGRIIDVKPIKGSKKLLKLSVDLGEDSTRTLVAGLAEHYSIDDLKEKKIIVVSNLKPATLFGVKSQGMLLAAVDGDKVGIVTVDGVEPGSKVE